jgi:hypothetical protein
MRVIRTRTSAKKARQAIGDRVERCLERPGREAVAEPQATGEQQVQEDQPVAGDLARSSDGIPADSAFAAISA